MILRLFIYAFLIFSASIIGGFFPLYLRHNARGDSLFRRFISLGAGILLGMSLLHMLPEASRHLPESYAVWFLVGFLVLLVLERFIMVHACDEGSCDYHTVGIAAFVGLTVHGIIEGLALGSSVVVSSLGLLVLVAILSHKVPSSFSLTSILAMAPTLNQKKILMFLIGVSLSGPAGMFIAYFLIAESGGNLASVLISVSAGTFLYIATCDLMPELHREDKDRLARLLLFMVGIAISYLSGFFMPEHAHIR